MRYLCQIHQSVEICRFRPKDANLSLSLDSLSHLISLSLSLSLSPSLPLQLSTLSLSQEKEKKKMMVRAWRSKREVYNEVLNRLMSAECTESISPGFSEQLWAHFDRLPSRYAFDVNAEIAEDVLVHMKLLQLARSPAYRPNFEVRAAQVTSISNILVDPQNSSLNRPMHEIVFSSDDKPKLLSKLTSLLANINLNIQEAHAFATSDGYSLDIFIVDGWPSQETDLLRAALQTQVDKIKNQIWIAAQSMLPKIEKMDLEELRSDAIPIPADGTDDWGIDAKLLKFDGKIASGSCGDLFRGTYCSQDVAIKLLKPEIVAPELLREFVQEIYIMRKVRHKNVVQFIGACTKPPVLCIVTEFMHGGSLFDFIHNRGGIFQLQAVIKIALDVSKGMDYLHQCNIIHRDLKSANLLMDERQVVKVADFGVARVKDQSGVMTAETGTYRWMAPEVIEHKPYDHKADVFSFGIVLWELLTGKLPYEELTPLQAAVAVVQKGLRPTIPDGTHPKIVELLEKCWQYDPSLRPNFSEILDILYLIGKQVFTMESPKKMGGRFFSSLMHRQ
ncbi:hypothetical protein LUZ60_002455 [Juncus effusus]|nr:hypothetical protein LUZ60_002455 [Juncus effusus]